MANPEMSRRQVLKIAAAFAGAVLLDMVDGHLTGNSTFTYHEKPTPDPTRIPAQSSEIIKEPGSQPVPPPNPEKVIPQPVPQSEIIIPGGQIIKEGNRNKPFIYLTVDDCTDPKNVRKVFDIAVKYNIPITLFPKGIAMGGNFGLYKEMVASKLITLENHTFNHLDLKKSKKSVIIDEITKQHDTVCDAVGADYKQYFFRPPFGSGISNGINYAMVDACKELAYKIAMWSSNSQGWQMGNTNPSQEAVDFVLKNVYSKFFKGVIILQHAIDDDILALPTIIEKAQRNGWQMKSLREGLLGIAV